MEYEMNAGFSYYYRGIHIHTYRHIYIYRIMQCRDVNTLHQNHFEAEILYWTKILPGIWEHTVGMLLEPYFTVDI